MNERLQVDDVPGGILIQYRRNGKLIYKVLCKDLEAAIMITRIILRREFRDYVRGIFTDREKKGSDKSTLMIANTDQHALSFLTDRMQCLSAEFNSFREGKT